MERSFDPVPASRPQPTMKDISFVTMGGGLHATSGPADRDDQQQDHERGPRVQTAVEEYDEEDQAAAPAAPIPEMGSMAFNMGAASWFIIMNSPGLLNSSSEASGFPWISGAPMARRCT